MNVEYLRSISMDGLDIVFYIAQAAGNVRKGVNEILRA